MLIVTHLPEQVTYMNLQLPRVLLRAFVFRFLTQMKNIKKERLKYFLNAMLKTKIEIRTIHTQFFTKR